MKSLLKKTACLLMGVLPMTVQIAAAHAAPVNTSDVASHAAIYTFASQTLTDQQFLTGAAGTPVTIAGMLRLPQGKGPFPAMVLEHGSSGIGSNIDFWVRELNSMGIATFVIDSMTGRGLESLGDKQGAVGRLNFTLDTYGALGVLAKNPNIDPKRIGLIGFSRGGQAVLYASVARFNKLWNTSGDTFANYVPFYPNCVSTYKEDTVLETAPVRIFHGGADDYNPPKACEAYVKRLKDAGADVEMKIYPGGHHAFDFATLFGEVLVSKGAQTARNCKISEGDDGVLMNLDTGKPFSYDDACVEVGPHVGGNAKLAGEALADVKTFLAADFKLTDE